MRIDDYLSQAVEIVEACKNGSMNADASHLRLEELNEEQIQDRGAVMKTSLQDFLEIENGEDILFSGEAIDELDYN